MIGRESKKTIIRLIKINKKVEVEVNKKNKQKK
jgi:hypothetical protein